MPECLTRLRRRLPRNGVAREGRGGADMPPPLFYPLVRPFLRPWPGRRMSLHPFQRRRGIHWGLPAQLLAEALIVHGQ